MASYPEYDLQQEDLDRFNVAYQGLIRAMSDDFKRRNSLSYYSGTSTYSTTTTLDGLPTPSNYYAAPPISDANVSQFQGTSSYAQPVDRAAPSLHFQPSLKNMDYAYALPQGSYSTHRFQPSTFDNLGPVFSTQPPSAAIPSHGVYTASYQDTFAAPVQHPTAPFRTRTSLGYEWGWETGPKSSEAYPIASSSTSFSHPAPPQSIYHTSYASTLPPTHEPENFPHQLSLFFERKDKTSNIGSRQAQDVGHNIPQSAMYAESQTYRSIAPLPTNAKDVRPSPHGGKVKADKSKKRTRYSAYMSEKPAKFSMKYMPLPPPPPPPPSVPIPRKERKRNPHGGVIICRSRPYKDGNSERDKNDRPGPPVVTHDWRS